jgi:hypothetical protein
MEGQGGGEAQGVADPKKVYRLGDGKPMAVKLSYFKYKWCFGHICLLSAIQFTDEVIRKSLQKNPQTFSSQRKRGVFKWHELRAVNEKSLKITFLLLAQESRVRSFVSKILIKNE